MTVDDARKLHLIIKWRPDDREDVLAAIGIAKERAIAMAEANEGIAKYINKVFH
jgi:hypothetical protein